MKEPIKLKYTLYWVVIACNGIVYHWSLKPTRRESWHAFLQGIAHSETKEQAQKKGCRCVKVEIRLAEREAEADKE